jgi:hypothetical protein
MSSLAGGDWKTDGGAQAVQMARAAVVVVEETSMREKVDIVRDTLIVLMLQLVFRTMMLLRRWNY